MNDGDKPVDRTRRVLVGLCLLAAIALIIAFVISQQPFASLGHKDSGHKDSGHKDSGHKETGHRRAAGPCRGPSYCCR